MGEITSPSETEFDPAVHLAFGDVAVDDPANPTLVRVTLKQSKTDQYRRGVDVFLGRTYNDLCPVAALLAYIAVRGGGDGPLFKFGNGRFLTRARFITRIREALEVLGLNSLNYAGHSFRIGAATAAAECGVEDSLIKALGRWESSAYQIYIRTPREKLAAISSRLAA